jgi:hypothetical protein
VQSSVAHDKTVPALEQIGFAVARRMRPITVPDSPHFDSRASTAWFLDKLGAARRYLEFGSGGSTVLAAKLGIDFVTVESDKRFLDAVRRKINRDGYGRPGQKFRYADIGRISRWGRPVGAVTPDRLWKFHRYSDVPEEFLDGPLPDVVLIDGRFRVACALKMLYQHTMRKDSDWLIVVDDATDRPDYRVLDDFADVEYVGRMAVLSELKPVAAQEMTDAIADWETIRD